MAWLQTLPAPVRVVHEAGPTGYGLVRALAQAGICAYRVANGLFTMGKNSGAGRPVFV